MKKIAKPGATGPGPTKPTMSPAARKKIAAAARKRWAAVRAQKAAGGSTPAGSRAGETPAPIETRAPLTSRDRLQADLATALRRAETIDDLLLNQDDLRAERRILTGHIAALKEHLGEGGAPKTMTAGGG